MNLIEILPSLITAATGPAGAVVVALVALGVVALALTKIPSGRQ
ncbi:hypothetical protein [Caulobacter radicis]|nr:hypothetical protein [Caulobacter radicis]